MRTTCFTRRFVSTLATTLTLACLSSTVPSGRADTLACVLDGYAAMGGMVYQTTNGYLLASDPNSPPTGGMETWGYAWLKFDSAQLPDQPVAAATLRLQSIAQTSGMWTAPEDASVDVGAFAVSADVAGITSGTAADAFRSSIAASAADATLVSGGAGFYEWDVTGIVNDWIAGDNFGLVLATSGGAIPKFHSRESSTGAAPIIETTPVPEPSVTVLVLSAFGLLVGWLTRGRK